MMKPDRVQCLALVAGGGRLPELVFEKLTGQGLTVEVLSLPGASPRLPSDRAVSVKSFAEQLSHLRARGCEAVIFAGHARRPPLAVEQERASWFEGGDDTVLRSILAVVERAGLDVLSVQDVVPELVAEPGLLTSRGPGDADRRDLQRAQEIVMALGAADVGQAAVVARGLCCGVETIAGTDSMLASAGPVLAKAVPHAQIGRGVLYKGPKPNQDLRVDLPAIGPATISEAARIGLSGIGVKAGSVLIIDKEDAVAIAERNELFILAD